jgi:hypothetical protein
MYQSLHQLPLSSRIPALADAIRSIRAERARIDKEEAELTELLRQAETELKGKPAGSEGAEPSGLVEEPAKKAKS